MSIKIKWAENALCDLEGIRNFIGRDSKYYSKEVIGSILNKVKRLKDFPNIGRKVPEMNDENIRELFSYSYRIIYKIDRDILYIITVIHGAKKLHSLM